MPTPWQRFKQAAQLQETDQIPVALIVDSPWLPGYAGVHTLESVHRIPHEHGRGGRGGKRPDTLLSVVLVREKNGS